MYLSNREISKIAIGVAAAVFLCLLLIFGVSSHPAASSELHPGMSESDAVQALSALSADGESAADLTSNPTGQEQWNYTVSVDAPMDRKFLGFIPLGHPKKGMCLTAVDGSFQLHKYDGGIITSMFDQCSGSDYDEWWELQSDGTWEKRSADDDLPKEW